MKKLLLLISLAGLFAGSAIAQTTLTLQPDSTTGNDVSVDSHYGSLPNPTNHELDAYAWTFGGVPDTARSFVQFDLTSIPPGAIVQSARLTLYYNPNSINASGQHSQLSGSNAAWIQRITSPWKQDTTDWDNQPSTTILNEVALPGDTIGTENYIVDVATLVQDMVDNPASSFGFSLRLQNEAYYRSLLFASSNHPNYALHPKLVITYTTGCTSLVLQPDSTTGNDVSVDSHYGSLPVPTNPEFDAYAWTFGGVPDTARSFVQFDLTSIPRGAIVQSARLTLYYNPNSINATGQHSQLSGSNAAWIQRIITPWKQDTTDWDNKPSTTSLHEVALPADTIGTENYIVDVATLVQDMLDNPASSFGFSLRLQNEAYYRSLLFASSNHPDAALHPKLEICYTTGCTSLVLQPDSTTGNDVSVDSHYGSLPVPTNHEMDAYAWTFGGVPDTARSFVQFDLSSIPSGAVAQSAFLTLYYNPNSINASGQHSQLSGSNAAWIQRVTTPWKQDTTDWDNQPSTTTLHEVALPADTIGTENYIVDVTTLVQDMIDSASTSFGFMLRLQDESYYRSLLFASSNHPNYALHPKLEICYNISTAIHPLVSPLSGVIIYPNPATNQLTIRTSYFHNEPVTISIINILGEIMHQEKLNWRDDLIININNLSSGIYFLEMKSENGIEVKKFVKE